MPLKFEMNCLQTFITFANYLKIKVKHLFIQAVTEPSWYQVGESLKIDAMFYIKRYDLYYRGEWKKGVPHGFGEVITQDGQYFKGYFKEGVARGPKSLFAMSPTTFYIGAVDFNQRNGNGKFVDGDYSYEG